MTGVAGSVRALSSAMMDMQPQKALYGCRSGISSRLKKIRAERNRRSLNVVL
jgi:hypothetical protein